MPALISYGAVARLAGAAGLLLAVGTSGLALAQAPGPATAAAANIPTYGPPLTGVCVFSRDTALTASQAGISADQQLQQISQGIQNSLDPERNAIANDDKALTAEKPKLTAAIYTARMVALQKRAQTYSQTVQTRNAQVSQTRDNAMNTIAAAVTPILVATITAHRCSVVLERTGIYGANAAMDLTPEVIQQLNTAMPTVAVSLVPPAAVQGQ